MITLIFVVAGLFLVVGAVVLAMQAGNKGGRNNQSAEAQATKQMQNTKAQGKVRANGSAND